MGDQSNEETIRITVTPAEYETIRYALRTAAGHLASLAVDDPDSRPRMRAVAEMDDLYDSLPELPEPDPHEAAALLDEWNAERSDQ